MGEKDHSDKRLSGDDALSYVPLDEIRRVRRTTASDPIAGAEILADLCRINTLYMIMQAGSGHIGSSFSSMDLIAWLWTTVLVDPNSGAPNADTYFSSKGHDAPALYSLLIALEKLEFDLLHRLRRLGGLPGHPDVETPFIAANTGSLGMGISKAYGMARAQRLTGGRGRIVVMTGDGELQEGQIWESLQPVANERLGEITVIVDHNKLQSDSAVAAVSDLGGIEEKFRAFGWEVARAGGHERHAVAAGTPGGRLRRRAAADGASTPGDRRARRRSALRLRHRGVQGGAAGTVHRVRHRGAAHGIGGGRHGAARAAAGGSFVRLFPVHARQRAHLQQRNGAPEDHLHGDARRRRAGRAGSLAPVGARHLGDRIGARPDRDRAVQRARGAARDPLGGRAERREHVLAVRQHAARSAVCAAGGVHDARRPWRDAAGRD